MRNVLPTVKQLSARLHLAREMCSGLFWLHSHRVVHRDLKLPNFLVFEDYTVKVAYVQGGEGEGEGAEEGVEGEGDGKLEKEKRNKQRVVKCVFKVYCAEVDAFI